MLLLLLSANCQSRRHFLPGLSRLDVPSPVASTPYRPPPWRCRCTAASTSCRSSSRRQMGTFHAPISCSLFPSAWWRRLQQRRQRWRRGVCESHSCSNMSHIDFSLFSFFTSILAEAWTEELKFSFFKVQFVATSIVLQYQKKIQNTIDGKKII